MTTDNHGVCYSLVKTLKTPSAVSSLAFGHAGHLFVGTDDGVLRVYDLSTFKVIKAVKSLGGEVSSIICMKRAGSDLRDAWIACGTKIMKFQLDTSKMIQTIHDALCIIELGATQDDLVNEIDLNPQKTHISFSTDKGTVGVVDITTRTISNMTREHTNVCGCVKFVPTRPKDLVSGGYDQKLFHFDYTNGNLLSEKEIASAPSGSVSLSPPFITSMAISSSGVLAAGTADGRLWISFAGESSKTNKTAKTWNGLNEQTEHIIQIAEGPVVAMGFQNSRNLTVSTLKSSTIQYQLVLGSNGQLNIHELWQNEPAESMKTNALAVDNKRVIVGGLQSDGSGVFEVWQRNKFAQPLNSSIETGTAVM